jgi:hypothetical protein
MHRKGGIDAGLCSGDVSALERRLDLRHRRSGILARCGGRARTRGQQANH